MLCGCIGPSRDIHTVHMGMGMVHAHKGVRVPHAHAGAVCALAPGPSSSDGPGVNITNVLADGHSTLSLSDHAAVQNISLDDILRQL